MINIETLPNGNLKMSVAGEQIKEEIRNLRQGASSMLTAESIFISEYLNTSNTSNCKDYEQVAPEEVGALTSAPIISDGDNCYGYMAYQVQNFLDELLDGKEIVWHKG